MRRKRINYDDDFVVVTNTKTGIEVYRGIEDYEAMKHYDWKWSDKTQSYHFGEYEKVCYQMD